MSLTLLRFRKHFGSVLVGTAKVAPAVPRGRDFVAHRRKIPRRMSYTQILQILKYEVLHEIKN